MQVKALVISEDANEYVGKKGQVKQQVIACLDQDPVVAARLVNTFDVILSEEEKTAYAGKLVGKMVTLNVKNFETFNSRLRAKSHIVEVSK